MEDLVDLHGLDGGALDAAEHHAAQCVAYGLPVAALKRLKELEEENRRLKRAVADLTLHKQILKEALTGKY